MKKYGCFILIFLLLLILPGVWMLVSPDRSFSDNENRMLAQQPPLRAADLLSGDFQEGLEQWLADQFPGRDGLMAADTVLKKALGYRDIGGAWLGRGGCALEMHTPEDFDTAKFQRNLGYLADLAREAELPASALLVPCAASVQPELLPAGAVSYDAGAAWEAARTAMPGVRVPDLTLALIKQREKQLFYRTDHHWTAEGVLAAYDCLTDGQGTYAGTPETFCSDFYGTTYSKTLDAALAPDQVKIFPVPDTVTASADGAQIPLYDRSAAERKDKYTVFLGGNHGLVTLTGGCRNGKTLLVLKDSFANSLAPLLTADYETVILVDLRYYTGSVRTLLAQTPVDQLLFVYEMSNVASGDDFIKLLL